MARITYVEYNGTAHSVEIADGVSLMEGAIGNGVPGIDGDCGGNCACATCHVHIGTGWEARTGARCAAEEAMLDLADCRRDNSRLACRIVARPELEGLVVTLPATQH